MTIKNHLTVARLPVLLTATGVVLVLAHILYYSGFGFDFTDEGFYLVWMSNPFAYHWSLTQFGFIYHPLYEVLNGNIAALRRANVLITFGLAWWLVTLLLKSLAEETQALKATTLIISTGIATTSLVVFQIGLLTPNYNTLTFQSLLITTTGLLLAGRQDRLGALAGATLVGIGGWLAFMAKPSTAVLLAIGVLIYGLLSEKFGIRKLILAASIALALLLISAFLIDGSISQFIDRLQTAYVMSGSLEGGHTLGQILRIDDFQLIRNAKLAIFLLTVAPLGAMLLSQSKATLTRRLGLAVSVLLFVSGAAWSSNVVKATPILGQYQSLIIFGLVFTAVLFAIYVFRQGLPAHITRRQWGIALWLLVMPYVFAFGTNNNYWYQASHVALFWLLAGIVLLGPIARTQQGWVFSAPISLAAIAISAVLLQTSIAHPYRQPQPLWQNTRVVQVGKPGSLLTLSADYADFIGEAKHAAAVAGFQPGMPIIDLTGHSPGLLYVLGARNLGQAWMIGGYPGSAVRAESALNQVPRRTFRSAWILCEENGPLSLPNTVVTKLGLPFPQEYSAIAHWTTAVGAGGYNAIRTQILYAPDNSRSLTH
ncbi:MAG: hypothetical protein EPN34_06105 [Burkholderiaceae bacterium]|nr:MAG: hypothetical protein EPN34_06105 [Burkholderiaceae bacterium]